MPTYFVIMCNSENDAKDLYGILKPYLEKRGLELEKSKTKITHISKGFDFLGFNIRSYKIQSKTSIWIKPSKESQKKLITNIASRIKKVQGNNVREYISVLNPVLIGTANYWSPMVAKEICGKMDHMVFGDTCRFLKRMHPQKSWKWIKGRYFKPDKTGQSRNNWILTDPVTGSQLKYMSWTPIIRHRLIQHTNSPYNKVLAEYFNKRDIKEFDRNNVSYRQKLAKKQNYKCPICNRSIVDFKEGLEVHHKHPRKMGGTGEYKNLWLLHISCHIEYHGKFPVNEKIPTLQEINDWIRSKYKIKGNLIKS